MKTAQMLHSGSCRLNHTPNEQRNGRHKIPAACRAAASLAACSASLAACCVLSFANHGNAQSKDGQENTAEYRREREIERERERERERIEKSGTKCISNHSDGFVLRPKWSGTGNTCSQFSLCCSHCPPQLLQFPLLSLFRCPSQTNLKMVN